MHQHGECIHQESAESGTIQVWQKDDRRSLWFDDVILQSEINLDDPAVLPNPVNRAMLAHLMFGQQPRRVLLAGCGGGAIGRWFHARSPETAGDAVELSAGVARIALDWFDFPAEHSHWQLHIGDVREFLHHTRKTYDFILVDLEENQYSPEWITDQPFLEQCHSALTGQGVLTLNLIPDGPNRYTQALWNIRQVFQRRTLCLPMPQYDNQLVMAFREQPDTANIDSRIEAARAQWGIEFSRYWQSLRQNNPPGSGIL